MAYGEYGVDGGGLDYGINGQLLVFRSCTIVARALFAFL